MEYVQIESHEYSLYEQITLSRLIWFHFVILVQKFGFLSENDGCSNGSK